MKKVLFVIYYSLLVIGLIGCASAHSAKGVARSGRPHYLGHKARVAVAEFENKAAKATFEIGAGLREMLVAVLVDSHRFSLAEHQVPPGTAAPASGAPKAKLKSADLMITAVLTEFEPQASGGAAGVGGGGGVGSGILGGILGATLNKARLALDMRIVDVSTSEVVAATRIQGQASEVNGKVMSRTFAKHGLSGGLALYSNTPMEKAIRTSIIEAVEYITQGIPLKYYKY